MKKAKTREERNPEHRYVVLEEGIGRHKAGIYFWHCSFTKGGVFARKEARSIQAISVPSSVTFATRDSAEVYLAGRGPLRWCAARIDIKRGQAQDVQVFQAHVKEHANTYYYGSRNWKTIVVRPRAKSPDGHYHLEHFATKPEAVARAREYLVRDLAEATKGLKAYTAVMKQLLIAKKRFGT